MQKPGILPARIPEITKRADPGVQHQDEKWDLVLEWHWHCMETKRVSSWTNRRENRIRRMNRKEKDEDEDDSPEPAPSDAASSS